MNTQNQPGTYGPWGTQPPVEGGAAHAGPQSNTVGLVGFILSLAGLICTLGLLSPIGALVSFFGLFGKGKPKGFAIAGVVIGLIGTLVLAVIGGGIILGFLGLRNAGGVMQQGVVMNAATQELRQFVRDNGRLPTKDELLAQIDTNAELAEVEKVFGEMTADFDYQVVDDKTIRVSFPGFDGQLGTDDDLTEDINVAPLLPQQPLPPGASDPSQIETESTTP